MDIRIKKDLEKDDVSPFHKDILKKCKALVKISRDRMSQYYTSWDNHHDVYRGYRMKDVEDKKADDRKEPVKMIIPLSYAQVHTFVAFGYTLFTQRPTFFELDPMGPEDTQAAKIGESLLQMNLEKTGFNSKLFQSLLDIAKFGMSPMKDMWVIETQKTRGVVSPAVQVMGITLRAEVMGDVVKTKYKGNRVVNISPYRFFPDVRLPLSRLQEGEFVASEDEYTMTDLRRMESDGLIAGVEHLKKMSKKDYENERGTSRMSFVSHAGDKQANDVNDTESVIITEVQVTLVPKDFILSDGKPMGPETRPMKYLVWYANDQRIVRCEPLSYNHDQYTYSVGEYNPDIHELVNNGLCQSIDAIQEVITWLVNSHITSVRKVIGNKFVVDPSGIELQDLIDRNPVLRLKPAAYKQDVRRFISQLNVTDVTGGYMNDAQMLERFAQMVTGISDNLLGQFSTGRRSAREAGNVANAATMRIKTILSLLYQSMYKPLGERMLSNLQQGLDEETAIKVLGLGINEDGLMNFKATNKDLVGSYDFKMLDMALPSEKEYKASQLQEILTASLSNPQAAQVFGLNPTQLFHEILNLRGLDYVRAMAAQAPAQAQVLPDDQVRQMAAEGQIVPDETMAGMVQ